MPATIESLRKKNWKVRVIHSRTYTERETVSGPVKQLCAKGGSTTIELTPPNAAGTIFRGVSRVHPNDNFNRKLGNKIALGRALKVAGVPEK